jgi:NADPH:quinone reductase-like Zn-dependent oxidoreductase
VYEKDGQTVKAIVQDRYGSPLEVLRLADVDKPVVEDDRALIRVRASSANAGDWRKAKASPVFARLIMGIRKPKTPFTGVDAAGVVEAVGKDVTHLKVGDEVFGFRTGSFGEYVSGKMFVAKPANLSFEQAATVPVAGGTALVALRDKGGLKPTERVLINGAGGGVGTFAVQIAKAMGAEVTAVTSSANVEMVRSIGADHVFDYTRDDFTRGGERYDLIVDIAGKPSIAAFRRVLNPGGKIVLVGAGKGSLPVFGRLVGSFLRTRLLKQPIINFIADLELEHLQTLRELCESGKVTPVIDRTYPLAQAPEAISYLETEKARGKVVITVAA